MIRNTSTMCLTKMVLTLMNRIGRSSRRESSWLRGCRVKPATFWALIKSLMMSWPSKDRVCKITWLESCIKLAKPRSILTSVRLLRKVSCKWVVEEVLRATTKILFNHQRHQLEHQLHHLQSESLVQCLHIIQRSTYLILSPHVEGTNQAKDNRVKNKLRGQNCETA